MKKILIITLIAILSLSSLSARPQFFFGGGVEWGKLYLGENEKEALNANSRYKTKSDGSYISSFVPTPSVPETITGLFICFGTANIPLNAPSSVS